MGEMHFLPLVDHYKNLGQFEGSRSRNCSTFPPVCFHRPANKGKIQQDHVKVLLVTIYWTWKEITIPYKNHFEKSDYSIWQK